MSCEVEIEAAVESSGSAVFKYVSGFASRPENSIEIEDDDAAERKSSRASDCDTLNCA